MYIRDYNYDGIINCKYSKGHVLIKWGTADE